MDLRARLDLVASTIAARDHEAARALLDEIIADEDNDRGGFRTIEERFTPPMRAEILALYVQLPRIVLEPPATGSDGFGWQICWSCKGQRYCTDCGGSGTLANGTHWCDACELSGKCGRCNGTGWIEDDGM